MSYVIPGSDLRIMILEGDVNTKGLRASWSKYLGQ